MERRTHNNTDDLREMLRNAAYTHLASGGHNKAALNLRQFADIRRELIKRGESVGTVHEESSGGVFNGKGAI